MTEITLETSISSLPLSVRCRRILGKNQIRRVKDLVRLGEYELLGFRDFGNTSLNEIKSVLATAAFHLGMSVPDDVDPTVLEKRIADLENDVFLLKAVLGTGLTKQEPKIGESANERTDRISIHDQDFSADGQDGEHSECCGARHSRTSFRA